MRCDTIRIKLADPNLESSELEAACDVLKSGWLVKGRKCRALEKALKELTGRRQAIAVSSGSMALFAAMKALDIGPGATVMVPALTFPAPAFVAAFLGATVRVTDVDPFTFNISEQTLSQCMDPSVSLVVAIDQFGMPAPVKEIENMLAERGVPVLVDAACSIGASLDQVPTGSTGQVSTFSFHPRKVVTTGEGGAVLTDDEHIARKVRQLADQGMEGGKFSSIGLNLRLGEVNAAIGLEQLKRLDEVVEKRRALADRYRALPLRLQKAPENAKSNYQTLVAMLPRDCTSETREAFIAHLLGHGIEAQIASYCLGATPGISEVLDIDATHTPNAMAVHERGVALPLHPGLTLRDVDEVVEVVHDWFNQRG